jgi:multidrug resistance efflux pump
VKAEAVRQESVQRVIEIVGTLAAEDQVTISSQADGAVSRILADLGDRVKTGQVLIELDREKLEYNFDQQKAALARALAKYGANEPGNLPPSEQTPDVEKAAAELGQAKQGYTRAQELNKQQLVPRQTLDDAEATLHSKQASYDSAVQNAKDLRADIDASNAMLKLADRQLRDTSIQAPFDGYVQKRMVSLGEFVKSQTPVMSIVRVDPLKLTGEIPEGMAPWVQIGQVPNTEGLLKPGTFARVRLTTSRIEQVMTIPSGAMQYRYGVNRAFVVADNRLVAHELNLGDRLGDRVEILGGVKVGDLLALTDVDNLADGMKVTTGNRQTE